MKIINRNEFLKLPSYTLYSKYEPCIFDDICIKGESMIWDSGNDFIYTPIADVVDSSSSSNFYDKLADAVDNKTSLSVDLECGSRDGLYDDDQLFAIWEKEDIQKLIASLNKCLEILK